MKDSEWRRLVIGLVVIWLVAIAMAWALSGCAQAVISMPVQVKPNSYVMYYAIDMNAAACWVDRYDKDGKLVGHDLCPATPVLGGFGPTMTGTVAIGTAVGAIAK